MPEATARALDTTASKAEAMAAGLSGKVFATAANRSTEDAA
jgi:hypothetical protein